MEWVVFPGFFTKNSNNQNIFVDSSKRRVDLEVFMGAEFKSSLCIELRQILIRI